MRKLWVRLGAYLGLTEEEEEKLLADDGVGYSEREKIINKIISDGRFEVSGETYSPQESIADFNDEYDTDYEECDYEFCM